VRRWTRSSDAIAGSGRRMRAMVRLSSDIHE
jgi:hypothetical protein